MKLLTRSLPLAGLVATTYAKPFGYDKPLVNSKQLQKAITSEDLLEHAQSLLDIAYSTPGRNRVFGSEGHQGTIKYIQEQLEPLKDYYNVELQPFVEPYSFGQAQCTVNDVLQKVTPIAYSPSGNITGSVVVVNNYGCNSTDFPSEVSGKIALMQRGTCFFSEKVGLAGAAGAIGAILYNNVPGDLAVATLRANGPPTGPLVPSVAVSRENGTAIIDMITAGETVLADLDVKTFTENRTTYNVIAQTKCGDQDNVIFLGAHSDSVTPGPGLNDNGSGSIGILSVAIQLAKFRTKNAIRFGWWSAEEFGLLGSAYYVRNLPEEERAKIVFYGNMDMIASPNYIYGIYDGDGNAYNISGPPGSAQIEKFFEDYYKENNLNSVPTAFTGRSDYGPFLEVGIPAGGLFTGAENLMTEEEAALFGGQAGVPYDVNYHRVGDVVDNLNQEALIVNSRAIAAMVAKYGRDASSIPDRDPVKVKRSVEDWSRFMAEAKHDHGHGECGQVSI